MMRHIRECDRDNQHGIERMLEMELGQESFFGCKSIVALAKHRMVPIG
jgi:hypothetical protein